MQINRSQHWVASLTLFILGAVLVLFSYHFFDDDKFGRGLIALLSGIALTGLGIFVKKGKYEDMKKCPFCAEEVHTIAIKCKHCGSSLIKVKSFLNFMEKVGRDVEFLDVNKFEDAVYVGHYFFKKGFNKYDDWKAKMIAEVGKEIEPDLDLLWSKMMWDIYISDRVEVI